MQYKFHKEERMEGGRDVVTQYIVIYSYFLSWKAPKITCSVILNAILSFF